MPGFHESRKHVVQGAFHHHLVTDHARVRAYVRAVRARVRPGDVVADLGAGSGLLGGVAARAGARRVLAVESDRHAFPLLERFVRENALDGIVEPVHADAESWVPDDRVDVVVCEMMETGLMNEDQVAVMNHVAKAWPHAPRAVVPHAATLTVSLVATARERHGFRFALPHFERAPEQAVVRLTDAVAYHEADFTRKGPSRIDAMVDLTGRRPGDADAVLLETVAHLGDGVHAGGSPDHASPLVLPLDEPVPVHAASRFRARVAYVTGSVTGSVDVDVTPQA